MGGWIKWYRQAEMNNVLNDGEPFDKYHAFLWLVEHANTKTIKGSYATVKRGQIYTSIRKLAREWGWGKDKTSAFLNDLVAHGMIKKDTDSNRTLLTIEKYTKYQGRADSNKDTNKDTNKDSNKPHNKKKEEAEEKNAPNSASCDTETVPKEEWLPPVEEW